MLIFLRGFQHQVHGAVPAVGKRQHCGALGYGTHARLRAGIAEAPLRGAAPLVSSATLRRNASMRLTTVCGGAKVFLRSGTALVLVRGFFVLPLWDRAQTKTIFCRAHPYRASSAGVARASISLPRSWPTPELRIPHAAAQTRIVSKARIQLDSRKSVRHFKGIICADVSEFESDMPRHAVDLCHTESGARLRTTHDSGVSVVLPTLGGTDLTTSHSRRGHIALPSPVPPGQGSGGAFEKRAARNGGTLSAPRSEAPRSGAQSISGNRTRPPAGHRDKVGSRSRLFSTPPSELNRLAHWRSIESRSDVLAR
jgi:hypothetical protein